MTSAVPDLPSSYYDFGQYVDRARWLTYYRQLTTILPTSPGRVLEIGVGPGIVRAVLRDRGVHVETVDVNASLGADHVADVRELPAAVATSAWDWVVCSRVLHHIPKDEVTGVLDALSALNAKRTLITVPREDLSIQLTIRRTAGRPMSTRIAGGAALKRLLRRRSLIKSEPSGVWMLNGTNGIPIDEFRRALGQRFSVREDYVLPDDPSHVFFLLEPKGK